MYLPSSPGPPYGHVYSNQQSIGDLPGVMHASLFKGTSVLSTGSLPAAKFAVHPEHHYACEFSSKTNLCKFNILLCADNWTPYPHSGVQN